MDLHPVYNLSPTAAAAAQTVVICYKAVENQAGLGYID